MKINGVAIDATKAAAVYLYLSGGKEAFSGLSAKAKKAAFANMGKGKGGKLYPKSGGGGRMPTATTNKGTYQNPARTSKKKLATMINSGRYTGRNGDIASFNTDVGSGLGEVSVFKRGEGGRQVANTKQAIAAARKDGFFRPSGAIVHFRLPKDAVDDPRGWASSQ